MGRLAIIGASGKLGFATLQALLAHRLIPADEIICTTSPDSGYQKLSALGVLIKNANWDDQSSLEEAFSGCEKLFLISSARVQKDFNEAPLGKGREEDHFRAIAAAKKARIKHIYYTSLAFANPSLSNVMTAHERTEAYLKESGVTHTIIREGLYNSSWPLYLGHYDIKEKPKEIVISGDSKISWTAISNLGLANALILSAPSKEWAGKTFYLCQKASLTLEEVAKLVSEYSQQETIIKMVSRSEHEEYHVSRGMDPANVRWWAKTYDALGSSECCIDDSTLEELLSGQSVVPTSMAETISEMVSRGG